ncbi:predicted protein [Naegleria gruberi]|uniref:Predicted protein n=1 Tax=Naegleria gruberi TaxID=5762 RepID=D2V0C8_NAEGR|nr:uncharacterized protein NAEGRDRAFT_62247 [Naegleria gruberi]EFC49696.1 predicted protein [Naegleria gruberi]|eukprot:XP_002682440.1 predicted protein [Naegleria gruberi strain NEG-M]
MKLILLLLSILLVQSLVFGQDYLIQTFAGGLGDSLPAKESSLNWPFDVSTGPIKGEYFISDTYNHRVRKILANGTMTTIAGTGFAGYNGDGILSSQAHLYYPYDVAVNDLGEVYIADTYNHRIRKILLNGTIITVAGVGSAGYSGDYSTAMQAKLNYPHGIYVKKVFSNGTIITIAGNGEGDADGYGKYNGDNMLATLSSLNLPTTVALNSLNEVFIADSQNHRIRKVSNSGIISTVAGTGVSGYSGDGIPANTTKLNTPNGITIDSNDNIIIADRNNHRIRLISNSSGIISTLAGNGTTGSRDEEVLATSAKLSRPADVTIGYDGELIITDTDNFVIRIVKLNGMISTIAGTGFERFNGDRATSLSTLINHPSSMAFKDGELIFCDRSNHRVRRISKDGSVKTIAGNGIGGYNGDGMLAIDAQLNYPHGVASDSIGNIYISDSYNHRVRIVFTNGTISTIAGNGNSGFNKDGIQATSSQLNYPFGIALNGNDELFISDRSNHRVRKVSNNGIISTIAGTGSAGYNGDVIMATEAKLYLPHGVSVDNKGNVYIADKQNHRIRKILASTGMISTIAGTGQAGFNDDNMSALESRVNSPYDVTVDESGQVIYIADTNNHKIRRIQNGNLTTIAGNGIGGYNQDGILSTQSQLYYPYDVSIDPVSGKIFIGDASNFRIRVLEKIETPVSSSLPKPIGSKSSNNPQPSNRNSSASSSIGGSIIGSIIVIIICTVV